MPHACGDEPEYKSIFDLEGVRMPHACGDEPFALIALSSFGSYAPRVWG